MVTQSLTKAQQMAAAMFDHLAEPSEGMVQAAQVAVQVEQDAARSAWPAMLGRASEEAMLVPVNTKERT